MRHITIKISKYALFVALPLVIIIVSLPLILASSIRKEQEKTEVNLSERFPQFPVTVDPKNKIIAENPAVNNYLEGTSSPLEASAAKVSAPVLNAFWNLVKSISLAIAQAPWYQNIASVAGLNNEHFIKVAPGMRKEQIANILAGSMSWNDSQKKEFLTAKKDADLPLSEGSFFPDTYLVRNEMTPSEVQELFNKNFTKNVLSRYSASISEKVPLSQALTVASLIQRETIGNNDMRLVSGIIWNRIFINMNLQVDATLQYAKANTSPSSRWWPPVVPKDKYIKSPYNTYQNKGLPPTPISNPSVGAILAALNPIETPCLFYFNDKSGEFHCSVTYKEHVAEIKK